LTALRRQQNPFYAERTDRVPSKSDRSTRRETASVDHRCRWGSIDGPPMSFDARLQDGLCDSSGAWC
jgi:hypothetical protein